MHGNVTLADLFDVDTLVDHVHFGYVHEGADPARPSHHILCYTPKAQFDRTWDDVTRACRGLTCLYDGSITGGPVDTGVLANAPVISRGIPKFFCVERFEDTHEGADNVIISLEDDDEMVAQLQGITVSEKTPVTVSDKLDGAMCVGYADENGLLRVHTKGSFASDEAKIANRWLRESFTEAQLRELAPDAYTTPVFEVITPEFPHIVSYGAYEGLTFLGTVENATGIWHPAAELKGSRYAEYLPVPEVMPAKTLGAALRLAPRTNREGVVVCVHSTPQRLLKVKYDTFLALQRIRNASATSQRELTRALALRNITSVDALEALDTRAFADIIGLDPKARAKAGDAAIRHIALVATRPLVNDIAPITASVTEMSELMTRIFTAADKRGGTEADYVATVLQDVAPDLRNRAFACKKLYLMRRELILDNVLKERS